MQRAERAVVVLQRQHRRLFHAGLDVTVRAARDRLHGPHLAADQEPHRVQDVAADVMQRAARLGVDPVRRAERLLRADDVEYLVRLDRQRPAHQPAVDHVAQVLRRRMVAPRVGDEGRDPVGAHRLHHVVQLLRLAGELLVDQEVLARLGELQQHLRDVPGEQHHAGEIEFLPLDQVVYGRVDAGRRVERPRRVEVGRVVQLAVADDLHALELLESADQPRAGRVEAARVPGAHADLDGLQNLLLSHRAPGGYSAETGLVEPASTIRSAPPPVKPRSSNSRQSPPS